VLLLIGLIGIVLYAFGLGRGHPIVISAVLNLDPFWAAIIAYLIAGKKIPTSSLTFTLCLAVAFVGAMLLAISQADTPSLSLEIFDSGSLLAAGLALPVPVLWALSGSLVGKWFADGDESACIAVTFITAAVGVVPVTLAVAYAQPGLTIKTDILPAIALLAAGTILATGVGRVLYQKALTVTDNNNGFVSIFFLLLRLPVSCPCGCRVGSASSNLRSAPFSSSALGSSPPLYWCSYGNHKKAAPIGRPFRKWT
jgi:drug/metabolite transporter (DMT)-like permease